MLMQAICSSATELVDTEAVRVKATPVDKVARTQALFLYQIIRLLDGDVTLRAMGEKDTPLLHRWLGELCKMRDNLEDCAHHGGLTDRQQPAKQWEVSSTQPDDSLPSLMCLVIVRLGFSRSPFEELS